MTYNAKEGESCVLKHNASSLVRPPHTLQLPLRSHPSSGALLVPTRECLPPAVFLSHINAVIQRSRGEDAFIFHHRLTFRLREPLLVFIFLYYYNFFGMNASLLFGWYKSWFSEKRRKIQSQNPSEIGLTSYLKAYVGCWINFKWQNIRKCHMRYTVLHFSTIINTTSVGVTQQGADMTGHIEVKKSVGRIHMFLSGSGDPYSLTLSGKGWRMKSELCTCVGVVKCVADRKEEE